ncbi:PKD domain-containing protein [Pseudoalteromonas fenneropenaei]|uniref:PKD domain-containing protein n=1 Tax=Pseudoalteromonas fenneropenaei TaxID=1737459 RepID=A0ABV7CM87_9GAMM
MKSRILLPLICAVLLAACGGGSSGSTEPTKGDGKVNHLPIAHIQGTSGKIFLNQDVQFSAEKSTDQDGDNLNYRWQLYRKADNTELNLPEPTAKILTLKLTELGAYELKLIVSDGKGQSTPAIFAFEVHNQPSLQISAGEDSSVKQGDTVTLQGTINASEGITISSYQWAFVARPAGSNATILQANAINSSFIADQTGAYIVQLKVTDINGNVVTDNVTISSVSEQQNSAPNVIIHLAKATLAKNEVLLIDGSQSYDPDSGDILTFNWEILSKPANSVVSLKALNSGKAEFAADTFGTYQLKLTVTDQNGASSNKTITLQVNIKQPPIAELGDTKMVTVGDVVTISCNRCYDPDGDTLTYRWHLLTKPQGSGSTLSSITAPEVSFTADKAGDYLLRLIINDGIFDSQPAAQVVTAVADKPPVAVIQGATDRQIILGESLLLDASGSYDPEGGTVQFLWSLTKPNNSNASIADNEAAKVQFLADVVGDYVLALTVKDVGGQVAQQAVTVQVKENNSDLTGHVVAKFVDPSAKPLANLQLQINDTSVTTDAFGNLDHELQLRPNGNVAIKINDSRVASASYSSLPVDEQNFYVNLNSVPLLAMQSIDLFLPVCSKLADGKPLSVTFDLDTVPARFGDFYYSFGQQIELSTLKITRVNLPAPTTMTLRLPDGYKFTQNSSSTLALDVTFQPQIKLMTATVCD